MAIRPGFVVAVLMLAPVAHVPAQDKPESTPERARVAWQYVGTKTDKPIQIFRHRMAKEWFLERPDGTVTEFRELSRTDQEIVVQNQDTKLIIRLTEGRGYWRQPKDDEDNWRTWVVGHWIDPPKSVPSKGAIEPDKPREVRLVCFVPSDREPPDNYRRKIEVVMEIVSEIFRNDLRRKRYRTDGFRMESDDDGAVVHLVRGDQPASYYNDAPNYETNKQWSRVLPAVRQVIGEKDSQVVVIFAETYDNGPAEHGWPGGIALGSYYTADGGAAVFSAHLLQDQFCGLTLEEQRKKFFDRTPVPGRKAWGQPMNTPRGKFAEHGIGAVAHELGHAFGLPHDRRQDDQFIMGNGFRNLRRNFSASSPRRVGFSDYNASLLMSSRYLNSELDTTDDSPPKVDLKLVVERPRALYAEVTASDDGQLRAAVFSDGIAKTIVAGKKLSGSSTKFRTRIPQAKLADGRVEIRVIVTDSGGNQTRVQKSLEVQ